MANIQLTGVGAFIIPSGLNQEKFLAIQEKQDKRQSNRLKGMLTLPMETGESGETVYETLERLFKEEVKINGYYKTVAKLGVYEINYGVVLTAFLVEVDPDVQVSVGTFTEEVNNLQWVQMQNVLTTSAHDLSYRPGVWEVVKSYNDFNRNHELYQPQVFNYNDIRHKISPEVFNLIEQGVTRSEALSRYGLQMQ